MQAYCVKCRAKREIRKPGGKPGDYMDLRAEMDCLVAISNCPQDRNPGIANNPTHVTYQRSFAASSLIMRIKAS